MGCCAQKVVSGGPNVVALQHPYLSMQIDNLRDCVDVQPKVSSNSPQWGAYCRHPNNLISSLLRSGSRHFKFLNKICLTIIMVCVEKVTHRKHDRLINVMTHGIRHTCA